MSARALTVTPGAYVREDCKGHVSVRVNMHVVRNAYVRLLGGCFDTGHLLSGDKKDVGGVSDPSLPIQNGPD